jgi:hypothetical protein
LGGWRSDVVVLAATLCGVVAASCDREAEPPPRSPAEESPRPESASPGSPRAEASRHLISKDEIDELREAGLTDPLQQLVDSLMAHPEIIPHAGVLGGRMGFYSPRNIHVLNARTVYARFDDGHIMGSGVFEFTIDPDARIAWRVLDSTVEDVTTK